VRKVKGRVKGKGRKHWRTVNGYSSTLRVFVLSESLLWADGHQPSTFVLSPHALHRTHRFSPTLPLPLPLPLPLHLPSSPLFSPLVYRKLPPPNTASIRSSSWITFREMGGGKTGGGETGGERRGGRRGGKRDRESEREGAGVIGQYYCRTVTPVCVCIPILSLSSLMPYLCPSLSFFYTHLNSLPLKEGSKESP
jgi:hypothetical protein